VARNCGEDHSAAEINEAYHGALNLLRIAHGTNSVQERQLLQAMSAADDAKASRAYALYLYVLPAVMGALKSLQSDLEQGLTGNIALQASGEVLGDMLGLAKEALRAEGAAEQNVAAVLVDRRVRGYVATPRKSRSWRCRPAET
jgi:hypothetical protein